MCAGCRTSGRGWSGAGSCGGSRRRSCCAGICIDTVGGVPVRDFATPGLAQAPTHAELPVGGVYIEYVCACLCTLAYVCMHVHACLCVHVSVFFVCACVCSCTCVCISSCMCVSVCACECIPVACALYGAVRLCLWLQCIGVGMLLLVVADCF
jgi:hypothetical protein